MFQTPPNPPESFLVALVSQHGLLKIRDQVKGDFYCFALKIRQSSGMVCGRQSSVTVLIKGDIRFDTTPKVNNQQSANNADQSRERINNALGMLINRRA